MRMKKRINTTLGELIAAVTDEVMPIAGSQANADALVKRHAAATTPNRMRFMPVS